MLEYLVLLLMFRMYINMDTRMQVAMYRAFVICKNEKVRRVFILVCAWANMGITEDNSW